MIATHIKKHTTVIDKLFQLEVRRERAYVRISLILHNKHVVGKKNGREQGKASFDHLIKYPQHQVSRILSFAFIL